MESAAEWIRRRRKEMRLRREDLTGPTGLSLSTLSRVEKADANVNRATVVSVGRALQLDQETAEALADWAAGAMTAKEFQVRFNGGGPFGSRYGGSATTPAFAVASAGGGTPIVGEVTAGGMVESMIFEGGDEPERLPIAYPEFERVYALRIRGDSMAPEYRAGDYLICQDVGPEYLRDGDDAVIQLDGSGNGSSTFKRCYLLGDGRVKLVALNAAYPSLECRLESIVRVGRVLGTYKPRAQAVRPPGRNGKGT